MDQQTAEAADVVAPPPPAREHGCPKCGNRSYTQPSAHARRCLGCWNEWRTDGVSVLVAERVTVG